MTSTLTNATVLLLTVLYALLTEAAARRFFGGRSRFDKFARPLLIGTVALHLVALGLRGAETHTCPVLTRWEAYSFVAFAMAAIHFSLDLRRGQSRTAVFVLGSAAAMQFLSAIFILGGAAQESATAPDFAASLHAFAALLGISGVVVAGIHGILYVLLDRSIRGGRYGSFYQRMPSLEDLADRNASAAATGFLSLSVTVGIGAWGAAAGAATEQGIDLPFIPIALTILVWALLGFCSIGHLVHRFGGVRLAWCTVAGLGAACVLLVSVGSRGVHG
jgi:HemX protein